MLVAAFEVDEVLLVVVPAFEVDVEVVFADDVLLVAFVVVVELEALVVVDVDLAVVVGEDPLEPVGCP